MLVLLGVLALGGELLLASRGGLARIGAGTRRRPARVKAAAADGAGAARLTAISGLALGVPVGSLIYWLIRGGSTMLPSGSILTDALHTTLYSAAAAGLATALAIPVLLA